MGDNYILLAVGSASIVEQRRDRPAYSSVERQRTPVDDQRADVAQRLLLDVKVLDEDELLGRRRALRQREDVRVELVEVRVALAHKVGGILLDLFAHLKLSELQSTTRHSTRMMSTKEGSPSKHRHMCECCRCQPRRRMKCSWHQNFVLLSGH